MDIKSTQKITMCQDLIEIEKLELESEISVWKQERKFEKSREIEFNNNAMHCGIDKFDYFEIENDVIERNEIEQSEMKKRVEIESQEKIGNLLEIERCELESEIRILKLEKELKRLEIESKEKLDMCKNLLEIERRELESEKRILKLERKLFEKRATEIENEKRLEQLEQNFKSWTNQEYFDDEKCKRLGQMDENLHILIMTNQEIVDDKESNDDIQVGIDDDISDTTSNISSDWGDEFQNVENVINFYTCDICVEIFVNRPSEFEITLPQCICTGNSNYCTECVSKYVKEKILAHDLTIRCPCSNPDGTVFSEYLISSILARENDILTLEKYKRYLLDTQPSSKIKTCPRCDKFTEKPKAKDKKVTCKSCELEWCFKCQAPFHKGMTCKNYQEKDIKTLVQWASDKRHDAYAGRSTYNAVKCPRCGTYTEKNGGCDQMHCRLCGTQWNYSYDAVLCLSCKDKKFLDKILGKKPEDSAFKAAVRFIGRKYFGSHSRRCRVCPQNKPHLSRVIRGSIVGLQVLAIPITVAAIGTAAVVVGSVVLVGGAVAAPIYGITKICKRNITSSLSDEVAQ